LPSLVNATIKDHLEGERSEKQYHDWQQSLKEVRYFIDNLTGKGDLIVDLCGGSFTTAHAVKEAGGGRRFVGCDVAQECVNIGKHRLAQVKPSIRLSA
jgi:DNA modification methylase